MLTQTDIKNFVAALSEEDKKNIGFETGDIFQSLVRFRPENVLMFDDKGFALIETFEKTFVFHVLLLRKHRNYKNAYRLVDEIIEFSKKNGAEFVATLVPPRLEKLMATHKFFRNMGIKDHNYTLFIGGF